jgi:hypothetical protein
VISEQKKTKKPSVLDSLYPYRRSLPAGSLRSLNWWAIAPNTGANIEWNTERGIATPIFCWLFLSLSLSLSASLLYYILSLSLSHSLFLFSFIGESEFELIRDILFLTKINLSILKKEHSIEQTFEYSRLPPPHTTSIFLIIKKRVDNIPISFYKKKKN